MYLTMVILIFLVSIAETSNVTQTYIYILKSKLLYHYLLGTGESYSPIYARFPNLLYIAELLCIKQK